MFNPALQILHWSQLGAGGAKCCLCTSSAHQTLLKPGVGSLGLLDKSRPLPIFVNQVLGEYSHAPSFRYCLSLLLHNNDRVE